MRITEIYIKNFGVLSERRFRFTDGLQVLYGENESGKSTLHAFIRAMLFGMERGRGKAAAKDDFTRYEPWECPGNYAGVLWFECGKKQFRLERNFGRGTKRVSLVCEDDGEELSVEHGDLEMLLGGITVSLYDSTVSVGQLAAAPGQALSKALENYAANFCETGGGDIDVNGVLQSLREKYKETEKALQKEASAREERKQEMLRECAYLEEDMAALSSEYKEKEKGLAAFDGCEKEVHTQKGKEAAAEVARDVVRRGGKEEGRGAESMKRRGGSFIAAGAAGVCAGVCAGVWGWLLSSVWRRAGAGDLFLILSGILFLAGAGMLAAGVYARISKKRSREAAADNADAHVEMHRIRWEMERIQAQWKEKAVRCSNLKEQCREVEPGDAEESLASRCRALRTAQEQMRLAADSLGNHISARLNAGASDIIAGLTQGKYRGIEIGQKLQITVWDGVRHIPAERLSRGTLEQAYLSLRLAAADIMQEETMPLILDDAFAFYDEKRLQSALKWLSRQERQVIILTCSQREEEIIRRF